MSKVFSIRPISGESDHGPSDASRCGSSDARDNVSTVYGDQSALWIKVVKHKKVMTIYDTYVVFTLITDTNRTEFDGTHFEVDRRYSEFEWLHSRLIQLYPSLFVPPLPGKMSITTLDRFADPFLLTRQQGLQTFLTRLARHPLLSANPDFIAFLSLLKDPFAQYRGAHMPAGTLVTMLSETRRLIQPRLSNRCDAEQIAERVGCEPTDLDVGLIGSKAMQQYEHEFRGYADETDCFLGVAQRMARVTEIVVSNLEGVGYGFEELSRCLSTWPPRLLVELDGRETITDPNVLDAKASSGSLVNRATLQWSRQRPLAAEALAKASDQSFKATSELATTLRSMILTGWKEMAAYAQAVQSVFRRRDNLEKRYFDTVDELRSETGNVDRKPESRWATLAKSYLPWRQRSLPEIATEACQLQDELTLFNGQIGAEYGRWKAERSGDTIQTLLCMSRAYLAYWTNVTNAWRNAVDLLERAASEREKEEPPRSSRNSVVIESPTTHLATDSLRLQNSNRDQPRILNRLDLDNDLDSDEFYLAPIETSMTPESWTPSDSPDYVVHHPVQEEEQ